MDHCVEMRCGSVVNFMEIEKDALRRALREGFVCCFGYCMVTGLMKHTSC